MWQTSEQWSPFLLLRDSASLGKFQEHLFQRRPPGDWFRSKKQNINVSQKKQLILKETFTPTNLIISAAFYGDLVKWVILSLVLFLKMFLHFVAIFHV